MCNKHCELLQKVTNHLPLKPRFWHNQTPSKRTKTMVHGVSSRTFLFLSDVNKSDKNEGKLVVILLVTIFGDSNEN